MINGFTLKNLIYNELINILDQKIKEGIAAVASVKASRDNETKSSMGDKYETGRAMMQNELERLNVSLNKTRILKKELSQININKENTLAQFGSLVITNQGHYFISIGMGEIKVDNKPYYAISLASPVGKALFNKKAEDDFYFQDRKFIIENIF
ncbi:MAG: transcription elongation factor [Flavobacteriaceae bacterium]|nr:transcription elongation factor [Flavobacteriaceae bacterium]